MTTTKRLLYYWLEGNNIDFLPVTPVVAQSTPANPTGTNNTTGLMMGLAGTITPVRSGAIMIVISGDCTDDTISYGAAIQIRFGTGTAPTNGATLTGTAVGAKVRSND